MIKRKPDSLAQAEALTLVERLLLFCVASRTEWEGVVSHSTVTSMMTKELIGREPTGGLYLTKKGRAVLESLL
jgi:hypothetical protein